MEKRERERAREKDERKNTITREENITDIIEMHNAHNAHTK